MKKTFFERMDDVAARCTNEGNCVTRIWCAGEWQLKRCPKTAVCEGIQYPGKPA